ncbi:MAG: hypothetical protein ACTSU5_03560 [Promethearchaeota archaeon]
MSRAEVRLLERGGEHWADPANRWHLYHHRPGPLVPVEPVPVGRVVAGGDEFRWRGYSVLVLDTPGVTEGAVSYLVSVEGAGPGVCFTGDLIHGPGRAWDLHSLQRGHGPVRDYHGFAGAADLVLGSLRSVLALDPPPAVLVPSHGDPVTDPGASVDLLASRLAALRRNYASVSSLNHYFPGLFSDLAGDPRGLSPRAARVDFPGFVRRAGDTSYLVASSTGAGLLVDCGDPRVVKRLKHWCRRGRRARRRGGARRRRGSGRHWNHGGDGNVEDVETVEACWVTHYHDDHVDGIPALRRAFDCEVVAERHVADVITRPGAHHLPCLSPARVDVDRVVEHGESWRWHEYTLTAFHFPGQTFHGAGLLVELGRGGRRDDGRGEGRGVGRGVFFAGDSFTPAGLDDYCPQNRVHLGEGRGFMQCVETLRALDPACTVNQHVDSGFRFPRGTLDLLERRLRERRAILGELLPWPDPNFGLDEHWVRVDPYWQDVAPGGTLAVAVLFTNFGTRPARAAAELVCPRVWGGWPPGDATRGTCEVPAGTSGDRSADGKTGAPPDGEVRLEATVPADCPPGPVAVAVRVWWDGRYLGQWRHANARVVPGK